MDNFKINVVFEIEKERAFKNTENFKEKCKDKYSLNDKECTEIYRKIINHQVKNYGGSLHGSFLKDEKIYRTDNHFKSKVHR